MLTVMLLSGCTDEMENVVSHDDLMETQVARTRAISEEMILEGTPKELVISEDMKKMKKLYNRTHSQSKIALARFEDYNSYDDTFWSNMFAIREMPATIKVRSIATNGSTSGYVNLYCKGKGAEVSLNNSNDARNNRFYIKVLPASTGIPYLIYSTSSGTPLTVGYYT